MKHLKKAFKILFTMLSIFLGIAICLFLYIFFYSPGKIKPYLDKSGKEMVGSIAEKTFLQIGGVKQGMFIRSKNLNKPVLLYIHGGPAFPNYFLADKYNSGLEDYFTVCYWEQRGGGLSYTSEVTLESMNYNQLALDAIDVSTYLIKRFKKEKIYIMAHSGGTPIALIAAQKEPKLFFAYIGMGQITNQAESEKIAYQFMVNKYQVIGNKKRIEHLKKYSILEKNTDLFSYYTSGIRDKYMHELGIGTIHNMHSVFWGIFIPVWLCKAYTIKEKINIWKSKFSFLPKTNLIKEILETDFTIKVPSLEIPVYFFSGKYDLTVNINLSKAYLLKLKAPLKGFYTFNHSAHSPLFEEPALVRKIIEQDILNNTDRKSVV